MRGLRRERHRELELAVLAVAHAGDAAYRRDAPRPTRSSAASAGFAQLGLARALAPEPERMAGMRLHGERDIVERGEIAETAR